MHLTDIWMWLIGGLATIVLMLVAIVAKYAKGNISRNEQDIKQVAIALQAFQLEVTSNYVKEDRISKVEDKIGHLSDEFTKQLQLHEAKNSGRFDRMEDYLRELINRTSSSS